MGNRLSFKEVWGKESELMKNQMIYACTIGTDPAYGNHIFDL